MSNYRQFIHAASLGGLLIGKVVAGKLARCKVDGDRGGKHSGAYRYFDDDAPAGIWWNWKTGERGTWSARPERDMTPSERAAHRARIQQAERERDAEQARQWQANARRNAEVWGQAQPITPGDPVARYLAGRGLSVPVAVPAGGALRHHPALPYWEGGQCQGQYPAMLAAIHAPGGAMIGLHRTFLTPDGRKADVSTARKLMPLSARMAGAAIRLGQPQARPDGVALAVAEGIETALAVTALHGIPCWAAISAGGLRAFEWPAEVTLLFVMSDHDRNGVGQAAGKELAQRAAQKGLVARNCIAPGVGNDWADVLAHGSK